MSPSLTAHKGFFPQIDHFSTCLSPLREKLLPCSGNCCTLSGRPHPMGKAVRRGRKRMGRSPSVFTLSSRVTLDNSLSLSKPQFLPL